MSSFGSGLGTLAGSALANSDLNAGSNAVNSDATGFAATTQPYNDFGQSLIPGATGVANNITGTAGTTQSYNDFMANYTNTPATRYQLQQANQVQNSSAAANGSLLSGANERGLATIDNGIVSTNANNAYNEYLAGNNQQFGQLTSAFSSLLGGIGVGTTATGQQAGVDTAQINQTSALAQAQAKNDQSKGSGLGSMFGGLGSFATSF
jgi:hypothetical protein